MHSDEWNVVEAGCEHNMANQGNRQGILDMLGEKCRAWVNSSVAVEKQLC